MQMMCPCRTGALARNRDLPVFSAVGRSLQRQPPKVGECGGVGCTAPPPPLSSGSSPLMSANTGAQPEIKRSTTSHRHSLVCSSGCSHSLMEATRDTLQPSTARAKFAAVTRKVCSRLGKITKYLECKKAHMSKFYPPKNTLLCNFALFLRFMLIPDFLSRVAYLHTATFHSRNPTSPL